MLYLAVLLALAGPVVSPAARAEESATQIKPEFKADAALQALAQAFFEWRRVQQPAQGDDIPRVERPDGWVPDFSPEAIESDIGQYTLFMESVDNLDTTGWSIADKVDARLLKAAIQRVYWELEVLKSPRRNPLFYVDQTLGSVFELLVLSSPMTETRANNIILRLEHFPETIRYARKNLDLAVRPFAEATIDSLADIDGRLSRMEAALDEVFPENLKGRLHKAVKRAISALEKYSAWLQSRLDKMQTAFAIGPKAYQWFLVNVALIPYTPDEIMALGQQAWNRSVAWLVLEENRNRDVPQLPLFENSDQQVQASGLREKEIRTFLETQGLMTVPDWLMHYRNRPMPAYLEPLAFLGVTDDLTSATRLDEDAYSYIREPSPDLPYFSLSAAMDPRPLIIHEGIPGHYYQLALSWANPDPIRRHFIDSGINEGIGFYVEEMLLQAGLFDFSPRSKEIIYSYARLRALRVEVDVRLAIGDFTIDQAADYLALAVPMDRATARDEAVFFAFNPGQAISYQVGKFQILGFLADAKLDQGEAFSLRNFNDFLISNGNVPVALQRWEYLGRDDAVQRLDALGGEPVSVPQ
jgi:uncharacterized protein (DUF885 family)